MELKIFYILRRQDFSRSDVLFNYVNFRVGVLGGFKGNIKWRNRVWLGST